MFFIRPAILFLLGLNVRHRERLPRKGPAILIANHNSHLDTMVLMSLFPLRMLPMVMPVAAADYFLRTGLIAWLSNTFIGIIPISRRRVEDEDPLAPVSAALEEGKVVIFFPEGSRGEPERMTAFKSGIANLAQRHTEVPVYPIFLHGMGKALPKGEALLVPFVLDVLVGEAVRWSGEKDGFLALLKSQLDLVSREIKVPPWM